MNLDLIINDIYDENHISRLRFDIDIQVFFIKL